jgi:hypothetical protein
LTRVQDELVPHLETLPAREGTRGHQQGARANRQAATRHQAICCQSKIADIAYKRAGCQGDRDIRQAKDRTICKGKGRLLQVGGRGGHGDERGADKRHHSTSLAERDARVAAKDFDPLGIKG